MLVTVSFLRACTGLALIGLAACGSSPERRGRNASGEAAAPVPTSMPRLEPEPAWPRYTLQTLQAWPLNVPRRERFDASGLVWLKSGRLAVINDRGPDLYEIQFSNTVVTLVRQTDCFQPSQLSTLKGKRNGRYDAEGVAQDETGRIYLCEEADRWILRCDAATGTVERLNIDWSPVARYFSPTDPNASFEGIAVGQGRLYLANERQASRIIVVDLASLKVVDDFAVHLLGQPNETVHYSDLCWFEGSLFVLVRNKQAVLKVNPTNHQVLAEYDYRAVERDPATSYFTLVPFGLMEGLAVDGDFFWLVIDNNGLARTANLRDTRPTLFKCPRPDRR